MILQDFITKHVPKNATIKVIYPRKNKTAIGKPDDFKNAPLFLKSYVFDFQISNGYNGYNCLIWITPDANDPILDLN